MTLHLISLALIPATGNILVALVGLLSLSVILILRGYFYFPHLKTGISFTVPPANLNDDKPPMVPAGLRVRSVPDEQRIICVLSLSNISELIAVPLSCSVALLVLGFYDQAAIGFVNKIRVAVYVIILAALAFALWVSHLWFWECRLLGGSNPVIGVLKRISSDTQQLSLEYEFPDNRGQHRLGYLRLDKPDDDNGVIVFYDPNDPNVNMAHRSLHFHSIKLRLMPTI